MPFFLIKIKVISHISNTKQKPMIEMLSSSKCHTHPYPPQPRLTTSTCIFHGYDESRLNRKIIQGMTLMRTMPCGKHGAKHACTSSTKTTVSCCVWRHPECHMKERVWLVCKTKQKFDKWFVETSSIFQVL